MAAFCSFLYCQLNYIEKKNKNKTTSFCGALSISLGRRRQTYFLIKQGWLASPDNLVISCDVSSSFFFFFMPFSQIFPPSPSPTESIRLFYTSVSLLLSRFWISVQNICLCCDVSEYLFKTAFYFVASNQHIRDRKSAQLSSCNRWREEAQEG